MVCVCVLCRMATGSKDGTWKFWNTDGQGYSMVTADTINSHSLLYVVLYKLNEDPNLLKTGEIPESGSTMVALAPDSRVVAVAVNFSMFIFSSSSGEMMEKLIDVHGG